MKNSPTHSLALLSCQQGQQVPTWVELHNQVQILGILERVLKSSQPGTGAVSHDVPLVLEESRGILVERSLLAERLHRVDTSSVLLTNQPDL